MSRYVVPALKRTAPFFMAFVIVSVLAGCDIQKEANAKFGDQHFKTAIALIELHKVRYGVYPESLKALKFTGDWDAIALNSVAYTRLDSGYQLNLTNGWVGTPTLSFPAEFWQGLGIQKSNVEGVPVKPTGP